jgi:hypothetical protein
MARLSQTLRKLGQAPPVDQPDTTQRSRSYQREREFDGEETQHDRFRRKQQRMAEQDTSSSLPIRTANKDDAAPKPGSHFEGPIGKLIEKYKDPREVVRHMTVGQYMRYELRDGQIWEGDKLIYDGTKHLTDA